MLSASLIFWRKASTVGGKVPFPSKSVLSIGKGSMSMYSISKPSMDLLSSIAITKHTQNQNPTPKKKNKREKKKAGKGKVPERTRPRLYEPLRRDPHKAATLILGFAAITASIALSDLSLSLILCLVGWILKMVENIGRKIGWKSGFSFVWHWMENRRWKTWEKNFSPAPTIFFSPNLGGKAREENCVPAILLECPPINPSFKTFTYPTEDFCPK